MTGEVVKWGKQRFTLEGVDPESARRLKTHSYEAKEIARVKYSPTGLPFVNLGACMGILDCVANARLKHPERHIALEANPAALEIAARNAALNGAKFKLVNKALAYSESVSFHIPEASDLIMSGRLLPRATAARAPKETQITVPGTTLEALLEAHGFEEISLCVDIEGGELDLIEREGDLVIERCGWLMIEWHFPGNKKSRDYKRMMAAKQKLKAGMKFHPGLSHSRLSVFSRGSGLAEADTANLEEARRHLPHALRARIPAPMRKLARRIIG